MHSSILARRRFLKTSSMAVAVAGVPNLLLAGKTDPKRPVVGTGEHRYECIHDWGELPAGHEYGAASHGTAIDSQGRIYITHHGTPGSIFVFDERGRFIRSLGEKFREPTKAVGHGIDIRREGGGEFLYLAPNNMELGFAKMTLDGELVWQKDREAIRRDSGLYDGPKARFRATNVNFLPDGGYVLGDGYGSGYLHRYDRNDRYVSSFGGTGTDAGKFKTPHGQWLDARDGTPKIAVCDRANARLQWFDVEGKHLRTQGGFLFPADIDVQGDVMLVPDLHARITLLDAANQVITHLGDDPAWRKRVLDRKEKMRASRPKWQPGRFVHPHDAVFDRAGNIFVAEWVVTGRVTKLRRLS